MCGKKHYKMKTFNNTVSGYRASPQFKSNIVTEIRPLISQERHKVNDYGMLNKVVVQQLKKKKKKKQASPRLYTDNYSHCQSLDKLASINRQKNLQIRKYIQEKAQLQVKNQELKLQVLNPTKRQQQLHQRIYDLQNQVTKLSSQLQEKQYKHKEQIQQLKANHQTELAAARDSYSKMDRKGQIITSRFYYQPTTAERPLQIVNSREVKSQSPRRYYPQTTNHNPTHYNKISEDHRNNQQSITNRKYHLNPQVDTNKEIQENKTHFIQNSYNSNRQYMPPAAGLNSYPHNNQSPNITTTNNRQTYQIVANRMDSGSYNNIYVHNTGQNKPNTYAGIRSYSPSKIQTNNQQNFARQYNNLQKVTPDTSKNTTSNTFIYKQQTIRQDLEKLSAPRTSNNAINNAASIQYKNQNNQRKSLQRQISPEPMSSNSRTLTFSNNAANATNTANTTNPHNAINATNAIYISNTNNSGRQVVKEYQNNTATMRQQQGLGQGSKGVTAKQIDDIYKRYCLTDK